MIEINPSNARLWSKLGSRAFGVAMLELGVGAPIVVAMTADLTNTSGLDRFAKQYPDLMYNLGIAEQNMIGVAAGMSKEGKTVFATTFSTFAAMRSYEQVCI